MEVSLHHTDHRIIEWDRRLQSWHCPLWKVGH